MNYKFTPVFFSQYLDILNFRGHNKPMRKPDVTSNITIKNNLVSITKKNKRIVIIKLTLTIIFSFGLLLYSNDEDIPFGINNVVYGSFIGNSEELILKKELYKKAMDSACALGAKYWRTQPNFRWYNIQSDSTQWDFRNEDSIVKWTGERGLHLLPVIGYSTKWAGGHNIPAEYKIFYPPDKHCWKFFNTYIRKLVERYDGDGIDDFKDIKIPIKNWQFMNEPFGIRFLGTPQQYVQMFDSARKAIKKADPDAKLGGPGLKSTTGNLSWTYYDTNTKSLKIDSSFSWTQMESLLIEDIGIKNIDFITHHLYMWPPAENINALDKLIQIINNLSEEEKPIWITETGKNWIDLIKHEGNYEYTGNTYYVIKYLQKIGGRSFEITDTILYPGDTIFYNNKPIIYKGGDIPIPNSQDTLKEDDIIHVYHSYSKHLTNPADLQIAGQTKFYKIIIDSLKSKKYREKVIPFFFCLQSIDYSGKTILTKENEKYYLKVTEAFSQYSLLKKNFEPLPAFNVIKKRLSQKSK